jgi:lysophospholipase L1-like esterase
VALAERSAVSFAMRPRPLFASLLVLVLVGAAWSPPLTIYLAGDSTMAQKLAEKRPETGWGEAFQPCFDPATVRVENRARNGRSTRSFIEEGLWRAITDSLRPGDYVFIQFGHNDESKEKVDRYTPPAAYRANLIRLVDDVRSRGATPVLLTPLMRRSFDSTGHVRDTHGEYPDLVRAVAEERGVALLDVHRASGAVLERYGRDSSRALFLQAERGESPNYPEGVHDNTHFSPRGAVVMAGLVIDAMRRAQLPLLRLMRSCPAADSVATR